LALLLAAALLLCHGVYGAYHQVHQTSAGASQQHAPGHAPHEGHAAASGAHTAGHAEGQEDDCSGCVAYSAVLLVLFLGALIALQRGARLRTSTAAHTPFLLGPVPAVLHAARGPTLPVLQVFRL
jgi:hypothetical protein